MAAVILFKRRGLSGKPLDPVKVSEWLARMRKRQVKQIAASRGAMLEAARRAEEARDRVLERLVATN